MQLLSSISLSNWDSEARIFLKFFKISFYNLEVSIQGVLGNCYCKDGAPCIHVENIKIQSSKHLNKSKSVQWAYAIMKNFIGQAYGLPDPIFNQPR